MRRFGTGILLAGLCFTQLPAARAGVPLVAAQIKSLVPGRYRVTLLGVASMTVSLRSNGTVLGAAQGAIDSGHWKLNGNEICISWNRWLGGSARCSGLSSETGYYQGNGFTITPV